MSFVWTFEDFAQAASKEFEVKCFKRFFEISCLRVNFPAFRFHVLLSFFKACARIIKQVERYCNESLHSFVLSAVLFRAKCFRIPG